MSRHTTIYILAIVLIAGGYQQKVSATDQQNTTRRAPEAEKPSDAHSPQQAARVSERGTNKFSSQTRFPTVEDSAQLAARSLQYIKEFDMASGPLVRSLDTMMRIFVPSSRGVRSFLRDVDRIKLAVYETSDRYMDDEPAGTILEELENDGWERAVKVREKDEEVWVLFRSDDVAIRDIYIVAINPDELIDVRENRRADRMIADVMERTEDDPFWDHRPERKKKQSWHKKRYNEWENKTDSVFNQHGGIDYEDPVHLHYNRVDGAYAGFRFRGDYHNSFGLTPFGEIGYAFNNDRLQYQAGSELFTLHGEHLITLGAELHDQTDTQDMWLVSDEENSLAGILFKEDFRDYYRRKGLGLFGTYNLNRFLQIKVQYLQDDFHSQSNSVNWSLLNHRYVEDNFRLNPMIDAGEINSMRTSVRFDTRTRRSDNQRGWFVNAMVERAGRGLGGDYDFERYLADMRRYQSIGRGTHLDIRLRLGTAGGPLPAQYLYDLGGFSTLRGYGFKAFTGDRMILLNAEYWIDNKRLWGDHWPMNAFRLGAFFDSGTAWFSNTPTAVSNATINGPVPLKRNFQSSAGFGVNLDCFRFYFAKPLQDTNNGWQVSLRINRTF